MENIYLRTIGFAGLILFLPIFLATFLDVGFVERHSKVFVENRVKSSVNAKIDNFSFAEKVEESTLLKSVLNDYALSKVASLDKELDQVKSLLKADAPRLVSEQLAKLRNLDCKCRQKWEAKLESTLKIRALSIENTKLKLVDFTQAKYMEIVANLTADIRIFTLSNILIFVLILIASFIKPQAKQHLILPASLIAASAMICSFFYIFEQNWIYTILYNDYTGFAYLGYLALVFAFLSDIFLNHARVTTEVINAILSGLGSALSVSPC